MKYYNEVKKWDDYFCADHVVNLVGTISKILKEKNITNLHYIDIGANVGKVYDLLDRQHGVTKVWMYEASPILFSYLDDKYKTDNKVVLNNYAVYKKEGEVNFDQSSLLDQIKNRENSLNFGLSKINDQSQFSVKVKSIKISDIIRNSQEIQNNVSFIKIDTENVDIEILEDLITVIDLFKSKPIIEFEINYFVSGIKIENAQKILDKFLNLGYNKIDLSTIKGDGILIPKQ